MKRTSTYFPSPNRARFPTTGGSLTPPGRSLGRLARDIAVALQGKDKPTYTPHVITGDHVVVLNAAKVEVTGRKLLQKKYYRHSGYVGNLKTFMLRDMMEQRPERVLQLAVKGMLPNNKMGRRMLRRLKVYAGDAHPHQGQAGNSPDQNEG